MKIAVSACLLGEPCRFDGGSKPCAAVLALGESHELVPVCPEVLGGLPVPHPPCEVVASESELRVVDRLGADVTEAFQSGAAQALGQAKRQGCSLAVLKANSPSCGSGMIYDGTFSGRKVPGFGVAARAFREAGIPVIDEEQLAALGPLLASSPQPLQSPSPSRPTKACGLPSAASPAETAHPAEGASVGQATSKSELILGARGVERLAASTVMVLGLGGVGSNCVEALARGGVGRLVVVDHDIVQESNINRQAIAYRSTLGRKKTEVVAAMVRDINPQIAVEPVESFVLRENVAQLLDAYAGQLDYVVDAIDTVSTKLALAELAQERGFRLISSMGAANKLQPECFHIADLYETENCPLCRIMRKEGRKRGIRSLRVLYSNEQPARVPSREGAQRRERSNLGTVSYAPPIMGQMIAGEVIRALSGITEQAEESEGCSAANQRHPDRPPSFPHVILSEATEGSEVEGSRTASAQSLGDASSSAPPTLQGGLLFDMHCHLDFATDPEQAVRAMAAQGVTALSATVTPCGYEAAKALFQPYPNIVVGLGLHPWWVADGRVIEADVARFEELSRQEPIIAEVGLDFGRGREATRAAQVAVFERVLEACRGGGKLVSLHATASAGTVLDLLERHEMLRGNACVFHWFSGTSEELQRAIAAGCFFSVGPRMLATKRGRAHAKAIPAGQLLLETDEPSRPGAPFSAAMHQLHVQQALAELESLRNEPLGQRVAQTSRGLLPLA